MSFDSEWPPSGSGWHVHGSFHSAFVDKQDENCTWNLYNGEQRPDLSGSVN